MRAQWQLVVTLGLVALTSVAQAQTPNDEWLRSFNEGAALLEDGRFADALRALERARALNETPAVDFNLAYAQRGLGQLVAATASLERCLARGGARIEPARRAEIERALTELRAAVAHVTIHPTMQGATVTVDGVAIASTQVDRDLVLDPGVHVFVASGDSLAPSEVRRELGRGEHVRVELAPVRRIETGTLRVEPSVAGATVFVDHRRAGEGVYESSVTTGRHEVEVRAAGYRNYQGDVLVQAGRAERLHVLLVRESGGGLLTRWWFWTAVGVAAAGVVTGIVVGTSGTAAPTSGTLGTVQAEVVR